MSSTQDSSDLIESLRAEFDEFEFDERYNLVFGEDSEGCNIEIGSHYVLIEMGCAEFRCDRHVGGCSDTALVRCMLDTLRNFNPTPTAEEL